MWPSNEYALWLHEQGEHYRRTPHPQRRFVQTGMSQSCTRPRGVWTRPSPSWRPMPVRPVPGSSRSTRSTRTIRSIRRPRISSAMWTSLMLPLPRCMPGELDDKPFPAHGSREAYNTPGLYPFPEMTDDDHRMLRRALRHD
ncbi:MAG: hypothetical protein R2851_00485 [Caldilineaceae bacterium]